MLQKVWVQPLMPKYAVGVPGATKQVPGNAAKTAASEGGKGVARMAGDALRGTGKFLMDSAGGSPVVDGCND